MQFSIFVLAACSFAASARAFPSLSARQTTADPCEGLGDGALATLPNGFSLAALNTSLPNANSTGAPLVLGSGGATTGTSFYLLATWASGQYNDHPVLQLNGGGLTGDYPVAYAVPSGEELGFTSTIPKPTPAPIYCAVPPLNPGGLRQLAVNGHADLYKLCPTDLLNVVTYNATKDYYTYKIADCYPVVIQIVDQ